MTTHRGAGEPDDLLSAPRTVILGYRLYLAAAGLSVVSFVVSLATRSILRAEIVQELSKEHKHVSDAALTSTLNLVTIINLVFAAIWVVAFVLLARYLRRGAGWARVVLVIVTLLSFVNFASGYGAGAAQIAVALVASVLVLLPRSTSYFAAVKSARAAEK
jgi:hypothetical protein